MASERAICVVVDDSRKIMHGLSPDTTAEDVIGSLKVRCGKTSPQVSSESAVSSIYPVALSMRGYVAIMLCHSPAVVNS